jgi:hypothetical protein
VSWTFALWHGAMYRTCELLSEHFILLAYMHSLLNPLCVFCKDNPRFRLFAAFRSTAAEVALFRPRGQTTWARSLLLALLDAS